MSILGGGGLAEISRTEEVTCRMAKPLCWVYAKYEHLHQGHKMIIHGRRELKLKKTCDGRKGEEKEEGVVGSVRGGVEGIPNSRIIPSFERDGRPGPCLDPDQRYLTYMNESPTRHSKISPPHPHP